MDIENNINNNIELESDVKYLSNNEDNNNKEIQKNKNKKKNSIIKAYKLILSFPDYKFKLNSFSYDENNQIICGIYRNKNLALQMKDILEANGLIIEIHNIY